MRYSFNVKFFSKLIKTLKKLNNAETVKPAFKYT